MKNAFKINDLNKSFQEFKLGPINLELEPGMVMGYIILNGLFLTYLDFISPEFFMKSREAVKIIYFSNGLIVTNLLVGIATFVFTLITFKKRKLYLE